jgi:hypothetical protein
LKQQHRYQELRQQTQVTPSGDIDDLQVDEDYSGFRFDNI